MSAREELRARFDELLTLERGWLDGGGEPVPLAVTAWFERWLSESSDDDLEGWIMFPHEEGGIELRRDSDGSRIYDSVEVLASTIEFFRCVSGRSPRPWAALATFDLFTHELLYVDADPI